ncbi:hypothetical protein GCM10025868_24840 [Angustibacter aerolatus]|uniref:DUF1905 domain-containing protein n=1 Tax=Angustibacter aerolatus TaxID=1162965 RepID=A0ABQ6JIR0_9ACTN|nr:hypothetical protein GCM10025868_24840 [Angustibacter aerolatus]
MIPVAVRLGRTTWTTSLWPRAGGYVVPLKDAARRAEQIDLGDVVALQARRRRAAALTHRCLRHLEVPVRQREAASTREG